MNEPLIIKLPPLAEVAGAAYVSDEDFGDLLILLFPDSEAHYAVLTAYMDESAAAEGSLVKYPVIAVGGGVGTGLQWGNLLKAWRTALDTEGIDIFHTSDFETREGRIGTVYETWDDRRLMAFQNLLLDTIKDNKPELAFAACVPVSEFDNVKSPYPDGRPLSVEDRYFLCTYLCLEQFSNWAHGLFGSQSRITYYFETGGPHEGQMREAYRTIAKSDEWTNRLKFWREPTLAPKDSQPGLQIADKFVYEGAKHASHFLDEHPPERNSVTLPNGKKVWRTRYTTSELVIGGLDVHYRMYGAQDVEKVLSEWIS